MSEIDEPAALRELLAQRDKRIANLETMLRKMKVLLRTMISGYMATTDMGKALINQLELEVPGE